MFLASRHNKFTSRIEISTATQVPHDYLLKVLTLLSSTSIVESQRGPGGGYRLAVFPSDLSALEVVEAVDTIPRITECPLGIPEHEKLCPLHRLLDDASRTVEEAFARTAISDLLPKRRPGQCDFPGK